MVSFTEEVINEIKCAATEVELTEIIAHSFERLKSKHFRNEDTYLMNMILSLQVLKAEKLEPKAHRNVNFAIEVFRLYRKQNPELLF